MPTDHEGFAPVTLSYADPEIFEVERANILWKNWVSVARVEDVADPGDWLSFDHAGEPVLVARGRDGVLRAFLNVCRHRLTTLAVGCGSTRSFQCPYHKWTFGLDGALIGAPTMEATPGFDREQWGLIPLAIDTWGGWVFVHLDRAARPLLESVPHLEASYPGAYLERLVRAGSSTFESNVDWKIVVENYIEAYHHIGPHAETVEPHFPHDKAREVDNRGEPWTAIELESVVEQLDSNVVVTLFPMHLFLIQRSIGAVWFKLQTPRHGFVVGEIQTLLLPELAGNEAIGTVMTDTLEKINAEDMAINDRTYAGVATRLATMGPLSVFEEGLQRFRDWHAVALAGGSASPRP